MSMEVCNNVYNKNLLAIHQAYTEGKRGIVLEGSSRSGKSYSVIDWLIFTSTWKGHSRVINIIKETYNSFKTTLYNDFNRRMPDFALKSPFENAKDVPSFWLLDTKVNMMGADQPSKFHGASSDFTWYNEPLPISKAIFDQTEMRCRKFWIMDLNPSLTDHWIFDLAKREDVTFFHSTFQDNPYIGKWEKDKILSYEPTPDNIRQGTADDYMWKVYGLGVRAAMTGLVFKDVTWIETFPEDCEAISYGMDFGFTNSPTTIVKVGRISRELYIQYLMYEPCGDPLVIAEMIQKVCKPEVYIWADCAEPGMIKQLRMRGLPVIGQTTKDIKFGLSLMNSYKIHIVKDANTHKEFMNYKYREINGIALNEPIDDYNHGIDAARYSVVGSFAREL